MAMPSSSTGKKRSDDNGKKQLEEGISRRPQADEIIGGWWRYFPLAAMAFGLGGFLAFALLLPGLGGVAFGYVVMYIAGFAMLSIFTYKQTRRLTEHLSREALIRQGMLMSLKANGKAKDLLGEELSAMERIQAESFDKEKLPKQLYAAMVALPLVGLAFGFYYLYHLNRVPEPHDSRWLRYLEQYNSAGSKAGISIPSVPSPTIPKRSFALYAILSLIFFPFLAYWYHLMIQDVNEHFKAQWKVEDDLLASFGT
jgi:hypothetical protein